MLRTLGFEVVGKRTNAAEDDVEKAGGRTD